MTLEQVEIEKGNRKSSSAISGFITTTSSYSCKVTSRRLAETSVLSKKSARALRISRSEAGLNEQQPLAEISTAQRIIGTARIEVNVIARFGDGSGAPPLRIQQPMPL